MDLSINIPPNFIANNWYTIELIVIIIIFMACVFITPINLRLKILLPSIRDQLGKDGVALITACAFFFIGIFLSDALSILLFKNEIENEDSIIISILIVIFELSLLYLGYICGESYWKSNSHHDSCPADIVGNNILYDTITKKINDPKVEPLVIERIEELCGTCRYNRFDKYLDKEIFSKDIKSRLGDIAIATGTPLQFENTLEKVITEIARKSFYTTNTFPPRYWFRGDPLFNWNYSVYKICWQNIDDQGEDADRLINFIAHIKSKYYLTKDNIKIEKIGKTYRLLIESNSFELILNDKEDVACLKENGSIIDTFKVKNGDIYLLRGEEKTRLINFFNELKNKDYIIDPSTIDYYRKEDNTSIKFYFKIYRIKEEDKKEDKLDQYFIFSLTQDQDHDSRDYVNLDTNPNLIDGDVNLCIEDGNVYTGMLDQLDFFDRFFRLIKKKREEDDNFIVSRILITDVNNTAIDWKSESEDMVIKLIDSYGPRVEPKNVTRIVSLGDIKELYYGELMIFDEEIAFIYDVNNETIPFGKKYGHIQVISGKQIIKELLRVFKDPVTFKSPEKFWPKIYKNQVKK